MALPADFKNKKGAALLEKAGSGVALEAAIPTEDPLPEQIGFTTYGPSGQDTGAATGWVHPARSIVGKTRSSMVRELQKLGLIDAALVPQLIAAIKANTLPREESVLDKAREFTTYRAGYEEAKAQELSVAKNLVTTGVMTETGFGKLLASYKPYELKRKEGLLPFCEHTLICQTETLPKDLQPFFETLFAQVQEHLLPHFVYQNLKATVGPKPPLPYPGAVEKRNYTLQFSANGSRFPHTALYNFVAQKPVAGQNYFIAPALTKGINKWLAQQAAPHRLHYANYGLRYSPSDGKEQFALLLLTQEQYKAWNTEDWDNFLFKETYDTSFTPRNVTKALKLYDSLGLFAHLTGFEKAAGMATATTTEINSYVALLTCFPKMVVTIDAETGNLENPYEDHVKALAAISRGAFQPTNIKDNFAENLDKSAATTLSFDFAGKHYTTRLKMEGDWLDGAFMNLSKQALTENKVDGNWYSCKAGGQESDFIFLTTRQYAALKKQQPSLFSF